MFSDTEVDHAMVAAQHLVSSINDPDALIDLVTQEEARWAGRNDAAAKLIKMFKDGDTRCTLDHLAYVGDHADEPYKSEANELIRSRL